ncbi:NUDIX domain-containing protein [Geodermatophilus sp. YIM 151500]|nr:NUDIX domain-containing protein [Geodermatophilus sp. YIM 151500]
MAVVLQVRAARLHVLLWQRANAPFVGAWALPGGPLLPDETLGASVARQLASKVELRQLAHLEQLETRSDPGRDPRGRTVATAYLGLIPAGLDPALPDDTAWHPVAALPPTAFDHGSIVGSALGRLRAKLSYTNVGFALAPPTFTIAELRTVYVAALGYDVTATNLQRVLLRRGVLEPTGEMAHPGRSGGRPAMLYRFASSSLEVTDPFAVFRPPSERPTERR